jgi:hypothetical protein
MLSLLVGIPLIYILAFHAVKMFIPDWSQPDRGFAVFEKQWSRIFAIAGAAATILAVSVDFFTPASTMTALVVGVISGLLGISAYTDGVVGKVPSELSSITVNSAFILGIGALVVNSLNLKEAQNFYQSIYLYTPGDSWLWIGAGVAVGLIGFLGWMRFNNTIGLIAILFSALGLWTSAYVGLKALSLTLGNQFGNLEFWNSFLSTGLAGVLAFILFTVAFELGAGSKLGGADTQALYAAGWAFGAIVGPAYLALGLVVAAFVQLIIHILARFINFGGYYKEIPNSSLKMKSLQRKWDKKGLEGQPPTHHKALALPFLPVMNVCLIAITVTTVSGLINVY